MRIKMKHLSFSFSLRPFFVGISWWLNTMPQKALVIFRFGVGWFRDYSEDMDRERLEIFFAWPQVVEEGVIIPMVKKIFATKVDGVRI